MYVHLKELNVHDLVAVKLICWTLLHTIFTTAKFLLSNAVIIVMNCCCLSAFHQGYQPFIMCQVYQHSRSGWSVDKSKQVSLSLSLALLLSYNIAPTACCPRQWVIWESFFFVAEDRPFRLLLQRTVNYISMYLWSVNLSAEYNSYNGAPICAKSCVDKTYRFWKYEVIKLFHCSNFYLLLLDLLDFVWYFWEKFVFRFLQGIAASPISLLSMGGA